MISSTCLTQGTGKELAFQVLKARSSVGERFLDTEEVGSSILPVPTIIR